MSQKLFVTWQDPTNRSWYPIGILSMGDKRYQFRYTAGAEDAKQAGGFNGLYSFPDFHKVYSAEKLFPVFKNRILSGSRPEYDEFISWLNLSDNHMDPIAILARTGGKRETDTLEVFMCPEPNRNGRYEIHFFAHGIRHLSGAEEHVGNLGSGTNLVLIHEDENKHDSLALRLENQEQRIGYCPRFLNKDLRTLMDRCPNDFKVTVERVNKKPLPIQFRLLCKFESAWPKDFVPFDFPEYQLLDLNESLSA